jgi:elongation factor Ts
MTISMDEIKKLREKTGAGVMDAKRALEEARGDMKQAEAWIAKKGLASAEKKADRETKQGTVGYYIHHDGKSGAMVKLLCETDFVAKTDDFQQLARELAMQVTSMRPETVEAFLKQVYVRDPKMTIEELVKQTAGKLGENVQVGEIVRVGL